MKPVWDEPPLPGPERIGPGGWIVAALRAVLLIAVLIAGVLLTLFLRLIERPLFGSYRPLTPWITVAVCSAALVLFGMRLTVRGHLMEGAGAMVSNHTSWLDIFVLNARRRVYFVSKSEVSGWHGINVLAWVTGTVFIDRDRRAAARQVGLFKSRLEAGHRLLFFPEGTSTDGRRVLGFKTTLFEAFFDPALKETLRIQPVTVIYTAPKGRRADFYGWWGDMDFAPSLLQVLAARPQGRVEVVYHPPLNVSDFENRKALAARCENSVRAPMLERLGADYRG